MGNFAAARQLFERWMEWQPEENAWFTYIRFELKCGEIERARKIYERFVKVHPTVQAWLRWAHFEEKHDSGKPPVVSLSLHTSWNVHKAILNCCYYYYFTSPQPQSEHVKFMKRRSTISERMRTMRNCSSRLRNTKKNAKSLKGETNSRM